MTKDEKYKHQRGSGSNINNSRNHHDHHHHDSRSNNGASSSSSFQPNKKKQTVVSLQAFARGKKGAIKALHSYRERKEQKRLHTAKALRSYSQVMKREGYEPGQGASRKRRPENDNGKKTEEKEKQYQHQHEKTTTIAQEEDDSSKGRIVDMEINNQQVENDNSNKARYPRTGAGGSHKQAIKVDSNNRKNHHHSPPTPPTLLQQEQDREKERRQKLWARKQKTVLLRQRTRKGQPIMKNLVHDILEKLQKEKQQQESSSSK
jgi:rRNA processing